MNWANYINLHILIKFQEFLLADLRAKAPVAMLDKLSVVQAITNELWGEMRPVE